MHRALVLLGNSPTACCFSIACGVGVLLSVAMVDPANSKEITIREIVGAIFLLLPGLAIRTQEEEHYY